MVIKGKTEELLVRQLKYCENNMQELTNSIKRPNMRIMCIEEKRCKRNEYIQQNNNRKFPKPRENYAHSGTGSLQTPNRLHENRTTP
jgi:hypothetical protein